MSNATETILEINFNNLKDNLNVIKSHTKPNTKILAVVKAFAYGSDAVEVAKELSHLKVDYFGVAYSHEGVALRNAGIETPILVLHPQVMNFKTIVEYNLEPSLYSFEFLTFF